MKIAIIGDPSLGGVQMRGVAVAELLGWPFIDVVKTAPKRGSWDVLILVKYARGAEKYLRAACERLIWDPLDCWGGLNTHPEIFWRMKMDSLLPDDVLLTSGSAGECIRTSLTDAHQYPRRMQTARHHCDPRLINHTGDPRGPVVYCGAHRYMDRATIQIDAACRKLGRRLLITDDPLKQIGAALLLHPRLAPHNYPLNRLCKPQVKLENAAALGVPVLATDDPCVTTCRDVPVLAAAEWFGPGLADALDRALKSEPLTAPVTLEAHCERLKSIVGSGI